MARNVLLLVLDSVRKDFYDRFAQRLQSRADVSFAHARAPSGWSTPSHASMFTGELPHQHHIHTYKRSFESLPSDRVFTTSLPHTKIGVTANVYAGSPYGFDRFFDTLIDIDPVRRFPNGLDPRNIQYDGGIPGGRYLQVLTQSVNHPYPVDSLKNDGSYLIEKFGPLLPIPKPLDDSGRAVLQNAQRLIYRTEEPWFMFINMMDAHIALQPFWGLSRNLYDASTRWSSSQYGVWELFEKKREEIKEYWNTRESLYGAYIDYLDRIIANFIDTIKTSTGAETTIVITADHGENHSEPAADGLANHKSSLAEPLLHVPLTVINAPGRASAPNELVSLLDLPALLTALSHGEWKNIGRETIAAEVMGLSAGPIPSKEMQQRFDRAIRTAIRGDTKVTWDSLGNVCEYRTNQSQPSWQERVSAGISLPKWATERFEMSLNDALTKAQSEAEMHQVSSSVDSRLRDLGYI